MFKYINRVKFIDSVFVNKKNMYKNYPKRFYIPHSIYFITTNTKNNLPNFKNEKICQILIGSFKFNKMIKKFKLFGFVIMYNHIHLLLEPAIKNNISEIMRSIKTNSAREINKYLQRPVGRVAPPDLRERGKLPRFNWQPRFYDHVIRDEIDFYNHLNYIYINPLKHLGIENFEYYKYSSCKF